MTSVVVEKQTGASEEGGSNLDVPLVNGVARDYELKCVLSESSTLLSSPFMLSCAI